MSACEHIHTLMLTCVCLHIHRKACISLCTVPGRLRCASYTYLQEHSYMCTCEHRCECILVRVHRFISMYVLEHSYFWAHAGAWVCFQRDKLTDLCKHMHPEVSQHTLSPLLPSTTPLVYGVNRVWCLFLYGTRAQACHRLWALSCCIHPSPGPCQLQAPALTSSPVGDTGSSSLLCFWYTQELKRLCSKCL